MTILVQSQKTKANMHTYRCTSSKLDNISTQLTYIFNLSFLLGVFPSILKVAKVKPVHEKESKCFAQIMGLSLYYSTLIKSLKNKVYIIETIIFLIKIYIPFSFVFDSIIQLCMLC